MVHLYLIYLLKIVIFNSYVSLPEGNVVYSVTLQFLHISTFPCDEKLHLYLSIMCQDCDLFSTNAAAKVGKSARGSWLANNGTVSKNFTSAHLGSTERNMTHSSGQTAMLFGSSQ